MGISTSPSVSVVSGYPDFIPQSSDEPLSTAGATGLSVRQGLFDILQEAIAIVNMDGIVCEWNLAMVQLSGITRDDALGCNFFALLPVDFEKNLAAQLLQVFLYQQTIEGEFTQRHAENEIFSFRYRVSNFDVEKSRGLAMISLVDKSDRDRLQRQLKKQEQLSMLGKLSSGIAYELAAPLDAICCTIEKMLGAIESSVDSEIEKGLNNILGEVYRISHLSNNIITLARNNAPSLMFLDLHELILQSITLLEQTLNRRPVCNVRFDSKPAPVLGDPILLQCVLQNLLKKAIDAAGDDAIPLLETSVDKPRHFVIRIEDRGVITTATAARIFEPSPLAGGFELGSGLGMFLSKRIIEAHKGKIKVEGQIGHGTVYTITLPTDVGCLTSSESAL